MKKFVEIYDNLIIYLTHRRIFICSTIFNKIVGVRFLHIMNNYLFINYSYGMLQWFVRLDYLARFFIR